MGAVLDVKQVTPCNLNLSNAQSQWSYVAAIGGLRDEGLWTDGSTFWYSNFDHRSSASSPQAAKNLFVQLNPCVSSSFSRFRTWTSARQSEDKEMVLAVVCQLIIGVTDTIRK
ncbi:hypothetical protein AAVH_21449 [Aphelenchoides avenae]|nr:hypothetical protein AAVH_21449 [Aphelenchus avenae]